MKDTSTRLDKDGASTGRGATAPGVICEWELYTLDEARRRMRWTDSALRAAKRRGLQLLNCGKRRYVTGREIMRFLLSGAAAE